MLPDAFGKALKNLFLPGIIRIFLLCVLAYMASWLGFALFIGKLISLYAGFTGGETLVMGVLSGAGAVMISWFLFPLLYPILISFFDEKMAEIIEREDYPQLPTATPPFWPTLGQDVIFSLKALGLNILCLPLYLIPLFGVLLYYGMNGYLLGTQFFRMSAGRRASAGEVQTLLRAHRAPIMLAGAAISFCATIPLLNFVAPVLGVATMLHLFHAARK